jgi:hypothetical protein
MAGAIGALAIMGMAFTFMLVAETGIGGATLGGRAVVKGFSILRLIGAVLCRLGR